MMSLFIPKPHITVRPVKNRRKPSVFAARITDGAGAHLSNGTLKCSDADHQQEFKTTTDSTGRLSLPRLIIGNPQSRGYPTWFVVPDDLQIVSIDGPISPPR